MKYLLFVQALGRLDRAGKDIARADSERQTHSLEVFSPPFCWHQKHQLVGWLNLIAKYQPIHFQLEAEHLINPLLKLFTKPPVFPPKFELWATQLLQPVQNSTPASPLIKAFHS